jgi:preprotein translocase subunit SecG
MLAAFIGYVVPVIHVLACLFLIVVVLLQTGKGADIGAVFGGGSQTLFGSGGAGNFLTKLTTGTAIGFMITSLILTWGMTHAPRNTLFNELNRPPVEVPAPQAAAPTPQPGVEVQQAEPGTAAMQLKQPEGGAAPEAATPPPSGEPAPAAPAEPAPQP